MSHSSHLGSKSQEWEALESKASPSQPPGRTACQSGRRLPPTLPWSKESKFSSPSPDRSESRAMSPQHSRQANPPHLTLGRVAQATPPQVSFAPS